VGTPRARQGSEEIRPKSPNVSNDTFSKRTGFSKIRRKQKIYVEFNNLQPGRRKENGDETKNKQLANRVAQNGNDNNKARGVTRRGGEYETIETIALAAAATNILLLSYQEW
jgi:hypothetical protein